LDDITPEESIMNEFELMEQTLRFWVKRDLGHFNDVDKLFRSYKVRIEGLTGSTTRGTLCLWTSKNRYSITFGPTRDSADDKGYLGCIAVSRKWRPGEDWHRGRDLPDGKFNETTWRMILIDIASYEFESPVAHKEDPITVPPSTNNIPEHWARKLNPCSEIPLDVGGDVMLPIPNLEEEPKT